jgi:hypothetical protein
MKRSFIVAESGGGGKESWDEVVVSFTCGMAIMAMTAHGQDARATPVASFQWLKKRLGAFRSL